MTLAFLYLVPALLGVILVVVSGLLHDLHALARHHVVVTHGGQSAPRTEVLGKLLGPGLLVLGVAGLVLGTRPDVSQGRAALLAIGAGVGAALLAWLLVPRARRSGSRPNTGVVVRDIVAGGFGQVRFGEGAASVVMAAQSVDADSIPAGTEVQIIDSSRSVLLVRRPAAAQP